MRKISYLIVNFYILTILIITIYKVINDGVTLLNLIIKAIIVLAVSNILLLVFEKLLTKIINYAIKIFNKKKMKRYSLFEWMGETKWLDLMDNLSNKKGFSNNDIHENYQLIKKEIRSIYNNIDKLKSLKIYLEVITESPKLTILNSVTQTILLAIITTSIIGYINGLMTLKNHIYLYLFVVILVWFVLLASISFINKEINKNKLLLKLVLECLTEDEKKI